MYFLNLIYLPPRQKCAHWQTCWLTSSKSFLGGGSGGSGSSNSRLLLLLLFIFIMPVVHGHGRGTRLGTCLVVKPCVSCLVSLQHVCMHHLRRSSKAARHTRYILVPQKGTDITLVRKPKATRLVIKYKLTRTLAIHALHYNNRFKLDFKQNYNIHIHFHKRPKPPKDSFNYFITL